MIISAGYFDTPNPASPIDLEQIPLACYYLVSLAPQ